jgi:hypothetical protein
MKIECGRVMNDEEAQFYETKFDIVLLGSEYLMKGNCSYVVFSF